MHIAADQTVTRPLMGVSLAATPTIFIEGGWPLAPTAALATVPGPDTSSRSPPVTAAEAVSVTTLPGANTGV